MFTYIILMASKTITIKEDVYHKLKRIKRDNESFSELLSRLSKNVSPLEKLKEMAGSIDFEDADALKKDIRRKREDWRG
jgi:predicted CopG family antitoxin